MELTLSEKDTKWGTLEQYVKEKENGKIIACVENDENRQLHDFIIQNKGKVHALYYIWKYGKNRIYGCAYIKDRDEHW